MVSYVFQDGEWEYHDDTSHEVSILLPEGKRKVITQLSDGQAQNTGGVVLTYRIR
jgi:hypothetical protein